ncbi:PAS domain-containing protein [Blastopirellula sp. JC732]|uniref:PAS domain-containing protein n=1 Tax=Blastopirellula sediminis TaxID=2894196 RepID=A0A9X1SEJ8_9BACT|nr:ATP-binding protein [Blastopirellula sediminis]MCC9604372.1 PAS domain-containing protein [Blastopirellula sediminis]MCC9626892.1 PAS domain-containing protein [Blastopirellula sediminis]
MTTDAANQYSQAARINELISHLDRTNIDAGGGIAAIFDAVAAGTDEAIYVSEVDTRWTSIGVFGDIRLLLPAEPDEFLLHDLSLMELVHPEDAVRVVRTVEETLRDRKSFDVQFRVRRRDGGWRLLRDRGSAVADRHARPRVIVHRLSQVSAQAASDPAEEATALRELVRQLETAQRLTACEIHDGFVQLATGALMHLEASDVANDETREAKRLLRESISEARRLMGGLQPSGLEEAGVPAAIDDFLATSQAYNDIPVALHLDAKFPRLTPIEETTLFRILQEAINNASKHSQSERIRVRLRHTDGLIDAEIRDWGRGFDPEATGRDGFGLGSMRQRAKLLGGRIQVTSAPGEGTIIRFRFEAAR